MQRIDIDIEDIAVLVNDPDGLLQPAPRLDLLKTAVNPHSVIDMGDVIPWLQFAEGSKRDRLVLVIGLLDLVFMITLEDLVIGVADYFQIVIDKAFVDGQRQGSKMDLGMEVFEDRV